MSSSPLGSSRSRHKPQSRSSSSFTPRNRRGSPLSATSNILSSAGSSSTGRSSTCNSRTRPDTGQDHFLNWYIPRHIAGSHGGTPVSHRDTPDYHKETSLQIDSRDSTTREISSPMHNDSKKMWLLKYSDDKIQSLPLPPSEKPKILEFPVQDNIANIFKTPTSYPLLYSRYGVPMIPILPYYPTNIGWSPYDHIWKQSQTSMLDPPPQGLFTHVGVAPRRDFTVAPDWRRISQYQL